MKAIILAAGYATRLYPLTLHTPKALLPINQKPIIDYIIDEVNTIEAVDAIYVVTNEKFYPHFSAWAEGHISQAPIFVINDGTTSEENRRGAIGDISFVITRENLSDELLIIAGDNFFTYRLAEYAAFYRKSGCDCVCAKHWEEEASLRQFGIALLDENGRVLDIEEKPSQPKSNTVLFATYFYRKETVPLFAQYLEEGNPPDAPGNFPAWLCKRREVAAYVFDGECYDIGTPESYAAVCEKFGGC